MVVDQALASKALIDLLPDWLPAPGTVQAVFPTRRGLVPSVRSFIDALAVEFARDARMKSNQSFHMPLL
jgi:DNA-binding transcriptional LysR family regulator